MCNVKFKRLKKRKLLSGDGSEENDEELINIEIHVSNVGSMFYRSEFYASRLMSNTVSKGRAYEVIPEIIMINILNYKMFDDRIGYRYFPRNGVAFYKGKFYQNVNGKLIDEKMNILIDKKGNEIIMDNDSCNYLSFIKTLSELPENEIKIIDEFLKKSERNTTDLAEKLNIDAKYIYKICDSFKLSYNTSNEDDEILKCLTFILLYC
ncbi:hypothetical protein BCR36DRAFT_365717 [Piromyces finnis]|uniref:Uncharacterized protein n=1 Tax=Piromyces finnis TaxID=1754191 RepID=A0A1Y1VP09_9FUNG|nr:hypothetical protein BCR36DRAFT_365717 [Piromyces finnis]|eukprot:ORX61134.1 hypothetical protein BCR36DRAFT_365717 [Piromyces finnis]